MPFCPKCGFKLSDTDEFCYKCGNKISIRTVPKDNNPLTDQGIDIVPNENKSKDQQTQMVDVCMSLITSQNWNPAIEDAKKIIQLYPADYRGYYCFILARTQNLMIKQNNSWFNFISSYMERILALYPDFKNTQEYERISAFMDMNDKYLEGYFKRKNIITWILVLIPLPFALLALIMIIMMISV